MAKLFEKIDDNPGSYFGMLVEGYDSTYASVMKQADSDAQKLRDSWEKDGGKSLFDTLSELGYESDYEDSPYMFKDADGGNTIVFDFRPINSFEDYVTYYVVDKDNRIPDGWTKTKLMIDFWKDKNESLKEDSEYKTLAKLSNGLEVISYPYGYAVSDGYVTDRFVVRDGKYIFDDGRFRLSDRDKGKILSLIKKGVIEESLKEDKNNLRNWIEKKVGKQMSNTKPTKIGYKHGRPCYSIDFTDGTSDDYFIDFDKKEIEKCESLKEDKFVSRDKMSKKDRKELDSKKRNTWGNTNPVTKVQPNKKAYDRKRDKKELDEELNNDKLKQLANKLYRVVSKYFSVQYEPYKRVEPVILSDKGAYQYLFRVFGAKLNEIAGDVNIKEFKNAIKSVFNEYGDFNVYFDKDSFYYFYSTEEIYGVDRKVKYIGFRWFWFEEKGYSPKYYSSNAE